MKPQRNIDPNICVYDKLIKQFANSGIITVDTPCGFTTRKIIIIIILRFIVVINILLLVN